MYQDSNMLASIRKVEAAREENAKLDPRRMTAEEKETLLKKFHPDYRAEQFTELRFGPNQGQKVPLELAELLEGESRILHETFDLTKPDYETDVLIIGGGGAGCSAAIEADNAGAKVMVVTKLRMGDANTMMAEGGIQAADKPNDSPAQHFLDAYGGGHFAAQKDLLYKLVMDAPEAIQWLSGRGVGQGARRHHDHHPRRRHVPQAYARSQGLFRRGDHAHAARRSPQPRHSRRRLYLRRRTHQG